MAIRQFGLIGYPLTHSFSVEFFSKKFQREGLSGCRYDNFPLRDLTSFSELISNQPGLEGLNVTAPYKEEITSFLDGMDETAREVGAVNCIDLRGGKLQGYNTDVYGFEMSIKPFLENKFERALILGTGGAANAVAFVLKRWGISVHFVSRNPNRSGNQISYTDLHVESMKHFRLIINASPVGTYPEIDSAPIIPYSGIGSSHFLYDLVYNPSETVFLRNGKQAGAMVMNGLKMLELQAERSWQIWNSNVD